MAKIKKLFKSFSYSLRGIGKVFKEEQNFKIHSAVTFLVLLLALVFKLKVIEFIILLLLIALVLILEIVNSIVERLLDLIKPRLHIYVEDIKDMSAAIVFIGALASAIIGILIFLPYVIKLII